MSKTSSDYPWKSALIFDSLDGLWSKARPRQIRMFLGVIWGTPVHVPLCPFHVPKCTFHAPQCAFHGLSTVQSESKFIAEVWQIYSECELRWSQLIHVIYDRFDNVAESFPCTRTTLCQKAAIFATSSKHKLARSADSNCHTTAGKVPWSTHIWIKIRLFLPPWIHYSPPLMMGL